MKMRSVVSGLTSAAITLAVLGAEASATELMPYFASVPTGWTVDRYDPAEFTNVALYQGRMDVLAITTDSTGTLANRPGPYQSTFYNTQGRGYDLNGGGGSTLSADLYVPDSWADAANGARRTDMWAVMTDGSDVTDYPIIGFTNYGEDGARWRIWDQDTTGWVDLVNSVNYDEWNALQIDFTGTSYVYSINGEVAYTDTTLSGSTTVSRVLMQVYNFGDPSAAPDAVVNDYTANWSIPEPGTTLMLASGLFGLAALRKRKAATPRC